MDNKTLLYVAAGLGAYMLLNKRMALAAPQQLSYIPPPPKNQVPPQYAHAVQTFNDAAQLQALEQIGVPVKPQSPSAKQQAAAIGGALGAVGAAGTCAAFGAAAAAPMCGMVGGMVGKVAAPVVYGAGKATGKVALKGVKVTGSVAKAVVKTPVKAVGSVAKKLKFW